jgi:hypothetical protein
MRFPPGLPAVRSRPYAPGAAGWTPSGCAQVRPLNDFTAGQYPVGRNVDRPTELEADVKLKLP